MIESSSHKIVVAILVTYLPDCDRFGLCLKSLENQISNCVIVDNTPIGKGGDVFSNYEPSFPQEVIHLHENKGIAFAQNLGIKKAAELNADYVLFLDQDSILGENVVVKLLKVFSSGTDKVAASCALACDSNHPYGYPLIVEVNGWPQRLVNPTGTVEVLHNISSGSLIPISMFNNIGMMLEDLFIDYVDIEWCLRARSLGFSIKTICDATLLHSLGEGTIKINLNEQKRFISRYSATRYYYQMRNMLLVSKMAYVSWRWIIWHVPKTIFIKSIFFILWSKDKKGTMVAILSGLFDGLVKKIRSPIP